MPEEEELSCRFEALKQSPPVRMLREKLLVVPLAAAAGSLALLALTRHVKSSKRPVLFRAGAMLIGGILGGQASALWLRNEYFKIDPHGAAITELRDIVVQSRVLKDNVNKRA